MRNKILVRFGLLSLLCVACGLVAVMPASAEDEAPEQKVAVKGEFVRLAHNDEGWVVVGYRVANDSIGDEWLLLDVGMTLMRGVPNQTLERDDLSVTDPRGSILTLATQEEFSKASLRALDARANMNRDSVNYFPTGTNQPCRIGFFTDVGQPARGMAFDEVELSQDRACVGRLYFHMHEGIRLGQHFLNVEFELSTVRVPFRIMTADELKENKKKWKELQKEMKRQAKEQKSGSS
jgi:hypothetical protein